MEKWIVRLTKYPMYQMHTVKEHRMYQMLLKLGFIEIQ